MMEYINKIQTYINGYVAIGLNILLIAACAFLVCLLGYAWYLLCATFLATMGLLLTSLAFFVPFILAGVGIYLYFRKGEGK